MNTNTITMPDFDGKREIIPLADGGVTYRMSGKTGSISVTRCPVFPGIDLIYNNVHMPSTFMSTPIRHNDPIIDIDHCREGRLEQQVGDEYYYLTPGDIAVHRLDDRVREENYPTEHYHGITVQINLAVAAENLSVYLDGIDVSPAEIVGKFLPGGKPFFALRQLASVEHIFSELYADNIRQRSRRTGYFRVKVLELLLFLAEVEPDERLLQKHSFSGTQVRLAKDICRWMDDHLRDDVTLTTIADEFHVSVSQVKYSFRAVYDMPPISYLRSQRIRKAAEELLTTDRKIADIAYEFGYENDSKFSSVFKSIIGVTPAQYRKNSVRYEM